jgi:hypothetical protein
MILRYVYSDYHIDRGAIEEPEIHLSKFKSPRSSGGYPTTYRPLARIGSRHEPEACKIAPRCARRLQGMDLNWELVMIYRNIFHREGIVSRTAF